MKTLRTLARWLYWRSLAFEGDPTLDKLLEAVWWHVHGEQKLRDLANAVPPANRV